MGRALPLFEAPEICTPCGGACCQHLPGATSPDDWGAPDREVMTERISAALATGRWSIDHWEGRYSDDYPRLRRDVQWIAPALAEQGKDDLFYAADAGGSVSSYPCTFLTPVGCELELAARPIECRALEPNPHGGNCKGHVGGKRDRAIEWAPYQDLIELVINVERDRGERSW